MEKILQNLVLPAEEKLQVHWNLFYRGSRCALAPGGREMHIGTGNVIDFATYLNGFSLSKWKQYTNASHIRLTLKLQGHFSVTAVGYHLNPVTPDRHEFFSEEHTFAQAETVVLEYPEDTEEQLLSAEILPYSDCVFCGGWFSAEFAPEDVRKVNLALATTTCHKEPFILHNIELLKQQLLAPNEKMREHFFVHVVDNGQTLQPEQIEGFHVFLHPNKNVGGSGGFARGMIEALQQKPAATQVLLMDDDVLVLPESIRRTYTLLTVLKPEYQDGFISGAMLEYGDMNVQHEDIGSITPAGDFCPVRGNIDQSKLKNVMETNLELPKIRDAYAAWWFCCIPAASIQKNGLPLPLFIRVDDSEYGLRCRPEFLSMTGLCVWHMGFGNKYNVSMDFYQSFRNMLIARATTGVMPQVDILQRMQKNYRVQMLCYAYNGAEIILRALEDYMKGPEFIMQARGEEILRENGALNEKMEPLSAFDEEPVEIRLEHVMDNPPRRPLEKWIFRLTYNGQRLWPKRWLKEAPGIIDFSWSYQPQIISLRRRLLAVNRFDRTAHMRTQDRAKFRELQARYKKDMKEYKRRHNEIEQKYREAKDTLTGEKFWRSYLEI